MQKSIFNWSAIHWNLWITLLFIFNLTICLQAQESDTVNCGSEEVKQNLIRNNENYQKRSAAFERFYQKMVKNPASSRNSSSVVHTIPVVVHIVHNNNPLGSTNNLTNDSIKSIIALTSQRFSPYPRKRKYLYKPQLWSRHRNPILFSSNGSKW